MRFSAGALSARTAKIRRATLPRSCAWSISQNIVDCIISSVLAKGSWCGQGQRRNFRRQSLGQPSLSVSPSRSPSTEISTAISRELIHITVFVAVWASANVETGSHPSLSAVN
jgi:hypothetical protein